MVRSVVAAFCLALGLSGPAWSETASWYGAFHEGHKTASGCVFHARVISAASPTLPLGTWLHVRNLRNNRGLRVQVTDRGPYSKHRGLDLSKAAAQRLGFVAEGTAPVRIKALRVTPIRCSHRR